MTRRVWLILSVAFLFGAQAPLCALACVERAETGGAVAVAGPHVPETAPCHDGDDGAPVSSESPSSDEHECRCDQFDLVLAKGDGAQVVDAVKTPCLPRALASLEAPALPPPAIRVRDRHRSLARPDILLLKSTLLL